MKVESIYDTRAIAREFHAMRNITEWNAMFPPTCRSSGWRNASLA